MLRELHIRDFAIIDELHLTLEPGFNILTGETGAGKSILIDAVVVLLGGRADTTMIRNGATRALVEGMFNLTPAQQHLLASLLEREDLEGEVPDTLWLSREIRSNGRTVARVNGTVVSLATLREVAEGLVDIHGQSEHLSLLRVREHLNLLDRYAGLESLRAQVAELARQLQAVRRELAELRRSEQERMQRLDLLRFQVEEINTAALRPGEKEALEEERGRLANAEQLSDSIRTLLVLLEEGAERRPPVLDLLGQAQRELHGLTRLDPSLAPQAQQLEEVGYQVEDLARALREYLGRVEFNPRRLAQVEDRLALFHRLERKYGGQAAQIIAYAEKAAAELATLEHSDERIAELEAREAILLTDLAQLAEALSRQRRTAARQLDQGVEAELRDLRMEGARFSVAFRWEPAAEGLPLSQPLPTELWVTSTGEEPQSTSSTAQTAFDVTGIDQVEFLLAANVGEGLKSLVKVASGGETARLMLALKTVLSRADRTPTLIFDEIDQGIGGRVGAVVGAKLWQLTAGNGSAELQHQVLCITHLPQLASFGDAHFRVQKSVAEGRTTTQVERLTDESRLAELAQMLGTAGEAALQGAHELQAQAEALKQQAL